MIKIINILLIAIFVVVFHIFGPFAFSQSTPPLDKPIEKPQASQMSESGRIQEKADAKRNRTHSPDSDKNHIDNPNVDSAEGYSEANKNPSGVKLHDPPSR